MWHTTYNISLFYILIAIVIFSVAIIAMIVFCYKLRGANQTFSYISSDGSVSQQYIKLLRHNDAILYRLIENSEKIQFFAVNHKFEYIAFTSSHATFMQKNFNTQIETGKSILLPFDSKDQTFWNESFKNIQLNQSYQGQWDCATANNKITFHQSIIPLLDKTKSIVGFAVVINDINHQEKVTEALKLSNEKVKLILRFNNSCLYEWNPNHNIASYSAEWKKLRGFENDEIDDDPQYWELYISVDDIKRVKRKLNEEIKKRSERIELTYRVIQKNNSIRWIRDTLLTIKDEHGSVLGYIGSNTDITQQKDEEARSIQFNKVLEQLVRKRTKELELSNLRLYAKEQVLTKSLRRAQDNEREISYQNQLLHEHDAQMKKNMQTLWETQQELNRQKYELETVNKELEEFAYVVSHDLKAPLRGISQLATWIGDDYAAVFNDEGKQQMELLLNRVKRLDNLINGILQYSRVGRLTTKHEKVNVGELIQEIINDLTPPAHISIEIQNGLPELIADQTQIEQLFQNLIGNAIKFIDKEKGNIQIGCVDSLTHWKFWVSDNGPGIEAKYHDKVFKVFQRLLPRDVSEGTGIGLSIVKKVVELYNGKVWIESEVGEGSSFYFTLAKSSVTKTENQTTENEPDLQISADKL